MAETGQIPRNPTPRGRRTKKATSVPPAKKKITTSKVKESSSNIESSSSIDLSAEQKKNEFFLFRTSTNC